jgi:membrane-bound serine protease (ClpP class)
LLAFYSLQTLPVNYTGLLLIGLGMVMFILEIKVTSFGMLFLGGVVAMSLGALMLIDSPEEYLRIPVSSIVLVVGTTAGLCLLVVGAAVRSMGRKPVSGKESMLGAIATVRGRIDPTGTVFVHGTLWSARSASPVEVGETVRVIGIEGMKLTVEKVIEEA